jgi:hypothetical protein
MARHRLARGLPVDSAQLGAGRPHVAEVTPASAGGYVGAARLDPARLATSAAGPLCREGCASARLGFPSLEGTALEERNLRHVFKRLLEKADLRQIRIHDLRHTYASLLLQQGESVVYVKEQLGHSSIELTVDTYGALDPGRQLRRGGSLGRRPDVAIRIPAESRAGRCGCRRST